MRFDRIIAVRNARTVFKDDDRAIKLFLSAKEKAAVFGEGSRLVLAESLGLPVPPLREITQVEGGWAIVTEYIEGKTMAQVLLEDPKQTEACVDLFLSVQEDLHSRRCPALPSFSDQARQALLAADLPETLREQLLSLVWQLPREDTVCHGDFEPSNILLTQGGDVRVLDWAEATRGPRKVDMAWTWLLLRMNGFERAAKRYRTEVCRRCGFAEDEFMRWIALAAAVHLSAVNARERSFLFPYAQMGLNEEEKA